MIDVIIPAYNAHDTIEYTIASIVSQVIKDKIRITIVNDASPNGDYSKFVKQFSPYINIQEVKMEVNGGPGTARRVGLESTSNPYVMFIDADDVYISIFSISELYAKMEQNPTVCLITGDFLEELGDGRTVEHKNDMTWVFGKMYRRAYLEKHNITFSDLRSNEDSELNTRIYLKVRMNNDAQIMNYNNNFFYLWRFKSDSITKINNFEYSFHTGIIGFIHAKANVIRSEMANIEQQAILEEIATILVDNYWQLMLIRKHRPDFPEFYNNVLIELGKFYLEFGEYVNKIPADAFAAMLVRRPMQMKETIIPDILFVDYLTLVAQKAEEIKNTQKEEQ